MKTPLALKKKAGLLKLTFSLMASSLILTACDSEPTKLADPVITKNIFLDQGWDDQDRQLFYNTSQGSNILPFDFFMVLKTADQSQLFRSDKNITKMGYLSQTSKHRPDALPIGFAKDYYKGQETYTATDFVGVTCAACHTNEIHYKDTAMRIDGGAALADIDLLMIGLNQALLVVNKPGSAQNEFVKAVLARGTSQYKNKSQVLSDLKQFSALTKANVEINHHPVPYGYGRMDAFGRIYNQTLAAVKAKDQTYHTPDAPVSYPTLWDTPRMTFVQWNGIGDNWLDGIGPLARNTGEIIGAFSTLEWHTAGTEKKHVYYRSSVKGLNLVTLEETVQKLHSPLWPSQFPAIDQAKAKQGKKHYYKYCYECHTMANRESSTEVIETQFWLGIDTMGPDGEMKWGIGTDYTDIHNATTRTGKSGIMTDPPTIPAVTAVAVLLKTATGETIKTPNPNVSQVRGYADIAFAIAETIEGNPIKKAYTQLGNLNPNTQTEPFNNLMGYKSGPLNGIWASAPYLHNGSVPTLADLLLPSCKIYVPKECRPNDFQVGSRRFDTKNVGFRTTGGAAFSAADKGNSNAGHEFAAGVSFMPNGKRLPALNAKQRAELVEYLKTL